MHDDEPTLPEGAIVSAAQPGIGESLRSMRERRRATVDYVAELLRLEPRVIIALEEERFERIGAPVFVKGHLKRYCELLGLDPAPLLDELRERLGGQDPPLQARHSADGEYRTRSPLRLGLIAAGVVALAGLLLWQLRDPSPTASVEEPTPAAAPRDEAAPQAGAAASSAGAVPASAGTRAMNGAAVPPPGPDANRAEVEESGGAAGSAELPSALADAPSVRPAEISAVPGVAASADANAGSADGDAARAAAAAPGLEIELRFVEDSWTEVTTAAGERLFYGLGRAGAEERIRHDGEIRVLLGNAEGVVVRVDGVPYAYPAGSRSGALARFRLFPQN